MTGGHWIPAVTVRVADRIIHAGLPATVTQASRVDNGPTYRIVTEQGELVVGASVHIALLGRKEADGNADKSDDGPSGDPKQRRRRRAV